MESIDWIVLLYGTLAIFIAAVVQGSTGLGFGMIAAPILMLIHPAFVPGPLLLLAMLLSFMATVREWHDIDWKGLSFALSGRIAGSILAGVTIVAIPLSTYGLVFGLLVLGAVGLSATGWHVLPSRKNLLTAGLASGYMGTLTSIGAPPIALVYQHGESSVVRSTLSVFLVCGAAISISALIAFGRFPVGQMLVSLAFLPAVLAGFQVSNWVVPRLNRQRMRYAVLALCALSSLVLVVKSIVAMI